MPTTVPLKERWMPDLFIIFVLAIALLGMVIETINPPAMEIQTVSLTAP